MKVVHIIFEARHEPEVLGLLHREIGVPDYLRMENVVVTRGVERDGGHRYRMDLGNSMMIIPCADDVASRVIAGVAGLRERLGSSLRAYAVAAEGVA